MLNLKYISYIVFFLLLFLMGGPGVMAQKNDPAIHISIGDKNNFSGTQNPGSSSTQDILEIEGVFTNPLEIKEVADLYETNPVQTTPILSGDGNIGLDTAMYDCPMMFVDVTIPFLQSCISSNATVSYCNQGTADASNVFIEVELDSFLLLDSASLTYTIVAPNIYLFQVGSVNTNNCGSVEVYFTTTCDSALINEEHCIHAHISPDTLCASVWNNHLINVDGICKGNDITFSLVNKGASILQSHQVRFIIIDDHLLVQGAPVIIHQGILVLGANQTMDLNVLGITSLDYKIEIRESNGNLIASSSVHNCSPVSIATVSNFHVQQFWNGSPLPSQDLSCKINGSSPIDASNSLSPGNNTSNNPDSGNSNQNSNRPSINDDVVEATIVTVFPNPFDLYTHIKIDGPIADDCSFRLYNITGKEVQIKPLSDIRVFRVERGNLLEGIYFYKIEAEGNLIAAGKIIIR